MLNLKWLFKHFIPHVPKKIEIFQDLTPLKQLDTTARNVAYQVSSATLIEHNLFFSDRLRDKEMVQ